METQAVAHKAGTNSWAIASFVLSLVWLWWIGSLLGLVFGLIAKRQIERSGGTQGGAGLATAGIVLSVVGLAILALLIAVGVSVGV